VVDARTAVEELLANCVDDSGDVRDFDVAVGLCALGGDEAAVDTLLAAEAIRVRIPDDAIALDARAAAMGCGHFKRLCDAICELDRAALMQILTRADGVSGPNISGRAIDRSVVACRAPP
jgi:hypothetical protein